jgi:multiple antibiotic resistance protein
MEELSTLNDILKFAITLISIINPIGVIPIFINLTSRLSDESVKAISASCALTVGITIILSLILGQQILGFFGISIASFTLGGGILLSSMAFSMIRAEQSNAKMNEKEIEVTEAAREIGVVPLAIPLLAGPGAISTSIIQANTFTTGTHWVGALIVVVLISLALHLILRSSRYIGKKLGTIGLNVMTRIMGIILLAISIELIVRGLLQIAPLFTMIRG